jgi:hypothetical protein
VPGFGKVEQSDELPAELQQLNGKDNEMDQTIQLAYRIAIVWAAGFLLAVAVRAMLPEQNGFTLTGHEGTLFIPFSRIGFWTCLLAALTVTALVVGRALLADIGWGNFR